MAAAPPPEAAIMAELLLIMPSVVGKPGLGLPSVPLDLLALS